MQDKKDLNIGKKYIIKDNLSFTSDYFGMVMFLGIGSSVFFFVNPTPITMVIGVIIGLTYLYFLKKKNTNLITSVTIYKYNVIFMEILTKNFKVQKNTFTNMKKIFKNKK